MVEEKIFYLGIVSDFDDFLDSRMSPPLRALVFIGRVATVGDERVTAADKFD